MTSSTGSAPSVISIQEYRKDVPPGRAPGLPDYPLRLFFERVKVWYRIYDGPDETVGPLLAGRLVGRAQKIALSLRLPDPHGNIDVGDAALVRLSVDEVRDPLNPYIILQQAIPSGVQALMNALKDALWHLVKEINYEPHSLLRTFSTCDVEDCHLLNTQRSGLCGWKKP